MDIKSLIDTILQSIATGTSSDVRINDRTFFSELMDDREDYEKAGSGEIRPRKPVWSSRKRFPLFSFLYSLLESLLSVVVWALYEFFSLLYGFFSGRKRNLQHSRRFNAAIFLSSVLVAAVVLVYSMVFFIKDVILFPGNMHTNRNGAIITEQPCSVEQYMLLFNSSSMWDDSGIEVTEGDRIEISYSGSFYGDIRDMTEKAECNDRLKYYRSVGSSPVGNVNTEKIRSRPVCWKGDTVPRYVNMNWDGFFPQRRVCDDPDVPFGALLYQIRTDNMEAACAIKPVTASGNKIYSDKVDVSGTLYFAVNDLRYADKLEQKRVFYDNCGELLINVRVYRNSGLDIFERSFRKIDTETGTLLLVLSGIMIMAIFDRGLGLILNRHGKNIQS